MSVLPIVGDKPQDRPKIRRSRASRWRAASLVAVHVVVAAHVAHWLTTGRTVTPVEPSEAMAYVKGGMVNAGLVFFAATILLTAVFGRLFCGWACHLVALQDLSRWLLEKVGIRPRPLRSRLLRWVPAIAFAYMFLWPVAYRLWIGDSFRTTGTEWTTSEFWSTFPGWIVGGTTFLVCGFAIIYFLGAKGFCTYACPYGAVFAAAERLSPMRIRVTDACQGCGHCTAVCTSNVRVHEEVRDWGMVVDSGCMKCRDCVSVCPNDALYYGFGPIPLVTSPRVERPAERKHPLAWWEEGVLAAAFAAAFFTFRGLYGALPFLLALGLAGVLAYLVLVTVRLAVRPNLAGKRFPFKRGGRLLPAGWAFLAAMAVLAALWVHSAAVQVRTALGERGWRATEPLRRAALDVAAEPATPDAAERALVRKTRAHLRWQRDWGFLAPAGLDARLAWMDLLAGASADLAADAGRVISAGAAPAEVAEMERLLAQNAWARGDRPEALAAWRRALAAAPAEAGAYVALGIALAQGGDLAAAAEVFDRGRAAVPDSPDLVYNMGLVRAYQGHHEEAIGLFQQALALNPQFLAARENLAGVLAAAGRFVESAAEYRRALAQAPDDADTRLLLARALAAGGRRAEAEAEAREVLRRAPGRRDAVAFLAELSTGEIVDSGGG